MLYQLQGNFEFDKGIYSNAFHWYLEAREAFLEAKGWVILTVF